jgi:hypothetical protein
MSRMRNALSNFSVLMASQKMSLARGGVALASVNLSPWAGNVKAAPPSAGKERT